jgi:hypothetical protein
MLQPTVARARSLTVRTYGLEFLALSQRQKLRDDDPDGCRIEAAIPAGVKTQCSAEAA